MKSTSKTLVFFGTEDFSLVSLRHLVDVGYNVVAVVTKPDSKKGRGHRLSTSKVKDFATERGIPVWQPENLGDIEDDISNLDNPAGVLVSYGRIIPKSIIDLFTPGIINVHPSLLPHYRGPSPIEAAIKNGDKTTGVSIMKLSPDMDAGPLYAQEALRLQDHETQPELHDKLGAMGAKLLAKTLPDILNGKIKPTEQDHTQATYCQLLTKNDSELNPKTMGAFECERKIRAHLTYPKSRLYLYGQSRIITKAHVSRHARTALDFLCQDGAYLCIDELIGPSGRRMTARDFINGYVR